MLSRTAVISLLFKLSAYIYLRVIPSRLAKFIIPTLFISYIASFSVDELQETRSSSNTSSSHPDTNAAPHKSPPLQPSTSEKCPKLISTDGLTRVLISHRTSTPALKFAALITNVFLAFCVADFTLRPFLEDHRDLVFTRVGAVEPTQVKILVRYPNMTDGVRIMYRQQKTQHQESGAWLSGPTVKLSEVDDWVGVAKLKRLIPAQVYQYRLALPNSTLLPQTSVTFRTFPDPRIVSGTKFRFIVSSCLMPNFPYSVNGGNKIEGFDYLSSFLTKDRLNARTVPSNDNAIHVEGENNHTSSPIEMALLLGDFIYADVPVNNGDSIEDYARLYRRNYASQSLRKIYEQLPIFTIYDDHEIFNNFAGETQPSAQLYRSAIKPFAAYQAQANYDPIHANEYYYDFRYADVAFFVFDTRRHRSYENGISSDETMLGRKQLRAFHSWLSRVNSTATYKFVVSSVPFTTLWNGDAQTDTWPAFEKERRSLLEALSTVPNSYILSGDRHEFAAVEHRVEPFSKILEISTSPFSMFWLPLPQRLKIRTESRRVILSRNSSQTQTDSHWLPEETLLKYVAQGHYKWSVIEIDTTDASNPQLTVELYVDGAVGWRHTVFGKAVTLKPSTALGAQLSDLFTEVIRSVASINDPISKFLSG